ncbi:MAG TPA: choice-of-anchor Q domain-containing protein [Acidimicrobiia bacterium]
MTSANDDGGLGTLRVIVGDASAGDTIQFSPALDGSTISLTQGPINVGTNVTISGLGADQLSVDGGGTTQLFDITGDSVKISGLTLADGHAGSAAGAGRGGAIRYDSSGGAGTLTLDHDAFVDNQALGVPSEVDWNSGGAVSVSSEPQSDGAANFNSDSLVVADSTFTGNASGGTSDADAQGGAIDYSALGSVTVSGSTFTGNSVGGNGGDDTQDGQGSGGALFAENAPDGSVGSVSVSDSTFTGNTAGGMGGSGEQSGRGFGGAVYALTGNFAVAGSTFSSNVAGGGGGPRSTFSNGGAIAVVAVGSSPALISNSTITGNRVGSRGDGGGVDVNGGSATLSGDTIDANSGDSDTVGSGLASTVATLTAEGTIVSGNTGASNCGSVFPDPGAISGTDSLEGPAGSTSCGFDLPSADPLLGALTDNGGPTWTQSLDAKSPAIGVVPAGSCALATDQRGFPRPGASESTCDVGAYETQGDYSPPVADAGSDQSVHVNDNVQLDASGSSQADGHTLAYQWVQTDGPTVALSDATATQPTFTAPGTGTTLKFEVTVTDTQWPDSTTNSDTSSPVTITVASVAAAQTITFTNTAPAFGVAGGTFDASATATSGLPVDVTVDGSSAAVCSIDSTTDVVTFNSVGDCIIHANQSGDSDWQPAPEVSIDIPIDAKPAFTQDSPSLSTVYGAAYSYAFKASGTPAATYQLAAGAPSWLHIDPTTGALKGTVPAVTTFTYKVIATVKDTSSGLTVGTATAGPFKVAVVWPGVTSGKPPAVAGSPLGYYIAQTGNLWRIDVTHPGASKVVFAGTITVNTGSITAVKPLRLEPRDTYRASGNSLVFNLADYGKVDGLAFQVPANATGISFTLRINGTAAKASQIFLGTAATHSSTGSVLHFTR